MDLLWVVLIFLLQDVGQSVENKQQDSYWRSSDGVSDVFLSLCVLEAFNVLYLHSKLISSYIQLLLKLKEIQPM